MTVRLVWAQSPDGVIGIDGELPWDLPEDRRLFKALTLGGTVVMGRRTWESLPERFRPLPGRRNVVLSSTMPLQGGGVQVARSVADVLALGGDVWIIGGSAVYAAFLPHAAEVVVTSVDVRVAGDTWAPELDAGWVPSVRFPAEGWLRSSTGLRFAASLWTREPAAIPSGAATVLGELLAAGTRR